MKKTIAALLLLGITLSGCIVAPAPYAYRPVHVYAGYSAPCYHCWSRLAYRMGTGGRCAALLSRSFTV